MTVRVILVVAAFTIAAAAALASNGVRLEDSERRASQLLKMPPRCVVCAIVLERQRTHLVPVAPERQRPKPKKKTLASVTTVKRKRHPNRPLEVSWAEVVETVTVVRCVADPRCR